MKKILLAALLIASGCASAKPRSLLCAQLRGAGPSSDALDPDHAGFAVLRLKRTAIRFSITSPDLGAVIAVHIHHGQAGINGPMLWEISPGYRGDSERSLATEIPPGVIALLREDPSDFYLKLHSVRYPGGAIRGQLAPCPESFNESMTR